MNKKEKNPTKKTKKNDLEQKCGEYLQGWQRAQADYQNLQKDTELWKADFVKYANSDIIMQILPILDNFKSAFKQIPDSEKDSAWVTGFSYIMKQLEELLKNNGVQEIKTVGEQFNCSNHEAIESTEHKDYPDNEIIEEKKPGYTLNDKVIQVAKVVVNNKKE